LLRFLESLENVTKSFVCLNPENALENLFRVETISNQTLRRLIFSNQSAAMLPENKAMIYCISGSHNEVRMHYLGLFPESELLKQQTK